MGCSSCGKRYSASLATKMRSTPVGSRTKIAVNKNKMQVKVQPQPEAGTKAPDTRGPIDPSTGQPISVIKNGSSGPLLDETNIQKPVDFKEIPDRR